MLRYVCSLGPVTLYSYGAMLALAFFLGALLAAARARKRGIEKAVIYDLVAYIMVFSLAGARLFFVAVNFDYYQAHPLDAFKLWEGGLVLYGGILFGFGVAAWFLKRHKLAVWKVMDIFTPSLALGIAIGRVGCFLNGCCYGKLSQSFGVCYPAANMPPAYEQQLSAGLIAPGAHCSLPVLPTQLYETAVCLAIFGALLFAEKRFRMFDGFLFWLFILLYSIQRFFMEGLRYYESNFFAGFLTIGQIMSLVLAAFSAAVILRLGLRTKVKS
jgi:phosphatidylglycerol:prolipoprotein diacylglycerol transferase